MRERALPRAAAILLALMPWSAPPRAEGTPVQLSGYYKNLLVRSNTFDQQPFTLDLNRLRLALKGSLSDAVSLDLQVDNELLLGNYLRTPQFQAQKDTRPPQFWRLEGNWRDTAHSYGTQRLYRASLNLSAGDTDLRVGRQRIAWGTGRFWSPLDLLNPLNPVSVEREERLGADAVLLERKWGPLSRASLVYAPGHRPEADTFAGRWHANAAGIDYSLVVADAAGTRVAGADFAGQLGQAGWRAELAGFAPRAGRAYARALAGVDYAFANSLTITAELYWNGAGAATLAGYDFPALAAGRIQSVGRRYAGVHASYDITPLVKWEVDTIVNLGDRSRYIGTALAWSVTTDLELRAGLQRFSGSAGTEFHRIPNVSYVQLQRFF